MTTLLYDYPRPLTFLHLEDNVDMHEGVVHLLTTIFQPAIRFIEVINGLDMLPQALAHQPDLLISDISHPGMRGDLVFEQIRRDPRTANIPYIFLTANLPDRFAKLLYESDLRPPEGYIVKPFQPSALIAAILGVLPFLEG